METLESLIKDYGGGRKKSTDKSQKYYDITQELLKNFHLESYREIELYVRYLREVIKITTGYHHTGVEKPIIK